MKDLSKQLFPPNPYKRSPIKKKEELAGRASELKKIQYYLGLTASGQSPHLALIGQRGVGKTSLLNAVECMASEKALLPIRLDMNEEKAKNSWLFWHDLYQTLVLSMVKAGCWGGVKGKIYSELLQMMYAKQPGNLEMAVLQIPYVFSCHNQQANDFICPDALVINDFEVCQSELKERGISGIVFLIDEADCLGGNVALLQMFRNIFQAVDGCSLVLAGTESVFPDISNVFSPIPRQFHRIDIKPFSRWSDTLELVLRPLPKEVSREIAPENDVVKDLHELCGGAPDEVQLYCHHMYREAEILSARMVLSPLVFREVLREYRSISSSNIDALLNSIELLPDKFLFESEWLSRRRISCEENIKLSILKKELASLSQIGDEGRAILRKDISEGYRVLFELGITESVDYIKLAGAPLTAGFWKSYVEVQKGKRWMWNDGSFNSHLIHSFMQAIGTAAGAVGGTNIGKDNSICAIEDLRAGKVPAGIDECMSELMVSFIMKGRTVTASASDCEFEISSTAGRKVFCFRFFEASEPIEASKIEGWLGNYKNLLEGNGITLVLRSVRRWELPSGLEMHRLCRISGSVPIDMFGPSQVDLAITKFNEGDIAGCADIFVAMLKDRDAPNIRNNLGFCQLVLGRISDGLENFKSAMEKEYDPLYEMNRGVGEWLSGDSDNSRLSMNNALLRSRSPNEKHSGASHVLVIEPNGQQVRSYRDLPLDIAILVNLFRIRALDRNGLSQELVKSNPSAAAGWMLTFAPDE